MVDIIMHSASSPTMNGHGDQVRFSWGGARMVILLAWMALLSALHVQEKLANLEQSPLDAQSLLKSTSQTNVRRRLQASNDTYSVSLQQPQWLVIPSEPDLTCKGKVLSAIENVVPFNESQFAKCPITSQVKIIVPSQNETSSKWILQSLDEHGNPKSVGGDEYYITWTDNTAVPDPKFNITHATLIARAWDQNDGSYVLDFATSPMNPNPDSISESGLLTVHFVYTCGVGRMGQPTKDTWNSSGYTHTNYTLDGVPRPLYRNFQPPQSNVDLGSYDAVVFAGDSVMGNFAGVDEHHFGKSNIYRGKHPGTALNTKEVDRWLDELREVQGALLQNASAGIQKTAVLVGSSTWDILNNEVNQWTDWEDHAEACRILIQGIRSEYPNVDVLWKSATALHITNPDVDAIALKDFFWGVEQFRYMSESRSYDIDQVQKKLMAELQVPVLDVYEATYLAADWSRTPSDARHYGPELNLRMLNWFYKT